MLSKKLLGSSNVTPLEKKELFVWGTNSIDGATDTTRPFGFANTTDSAIISEVYIDNTVDEFTNVSDEIVFNTLPKNIEGIGAVLDAGRQLHLFGNFETIANANFTSGASSLNPGTSLALRQREAVAHSWIEVACGGNTTHLIRSDGKLFVTGTPANGSSGDGNNTGRSSFTQVGSKTWSKISVAQRTGSHVLAIDTDGKLFAWGLAENGQLGIALPQSVLLQISYPVQIGSSSWSQVSAGDKFSAALTAEGRLFTWGDNTYGQLGNNSVGGIWTTPQSISPSVSWSQISCGAEHMSAIRADSKLYTWGRNTYGQLGDGTIIARSSPVLVGTSSWSQVASGVDHNMMLTVDGLLFTTGNNNFGQLGDGTILPKSAPVQIGASSWTQIRTYSNGTFNTSGGLIENRATGSLSNLWLWGYNTNFFTGSGRSSPVQVSAGVGYLTGYVNYEKFDLGSVHSVLIDNNNTAAAANNRPTSVWGLGSNTFGARGTTFGGTTPGAVYFTYIEPAIQRYSADKWKKLSVDRSTAVAIKSDGTLWGWGLNSSGKLGSYAGAPGTYFSSPVLLRPTSEKWSDVSVTTENTLAIRNNGMLYGSGSNRDGQLGLDTGNGDGGIDSYQPFIVNDFTLINTDSWNQVYSKSDRSIGIKSDNSLYGWGNNSITFRDTNTVTSNPNPVASWSIATTICNPAAEQNMFISSDGRLFGWGQSGFGQLGTGLQSTPRSSRPVQVVSGSWKQVAVGRLHTLAIKDDGTLWAWGQDTEGQLGQGIKANRSSPVQIGTSSWTQVAAGSDVSLAIDNTGRLFSWGTNTYGALGGNVSNLTRRSSPVQIHSGSTHQQVVVNGDVAGDAVATITTSGGVSGILRAWGSSRSGTFAPAGITTYYSSPVLVQSGSWTQVVLSGSNLFSISTDGTLWSRGLNTNGQLGVGDVISRSSPVQIGAGTWSKISTGGTHALAITSTGELYSWGNNAGGKLGLGNLIARSSPVQVGAGTWLDVIATSDYSFAIDTSSQLYSWGSGAFGLLGLGDEISRSSPVQVTTDTLTLNAPVQIFNNVAEASIGESHAALISLSGDLRAWGNNQFGQIGDNTRVDKTSPTAPNTLITNWSKVSVGKKHTIAISEGGALYGWGNNEFNQVVVTNIQTDNKLFSWRQIEQPWQIWGVGETTIGIRADGSLWVWGSNGNGRLGLNDSVNRSYPTQLGTNSWSQISVGSMVAGIDTQGRLYTWGDNSSGQLGHNDRVSRSSPTQLGASSWSQVRVMYSSIMAIDANGRLFSWGDNLSGVLGHNDLVSRSSPVQVGASSWTQVKMGYPFLLSGAYGASAAAIRSDGGLFTWGDNDFGQLGSSNRISRSSPVQVGTSSWTQVDIDAHTAAITSIGRLFTWGQNTTGELGSGTVLRRSSPVQVGASSWTQVHVQQQRTTAIKLDRTLWFMGQGTGGSAGIDRSSPVQLGASTGDTFYKINSGYSREYFSPYDPLNEHNVMTDFSSSNPQPQLVWQRPAKLTVNRSTPSQIGTDTGWSDIVASDRYNYGLKSSS
jgi:alpha-tubulin suppressor-like RCC1 family protein